jgi:hypothetical protein
MTPDCLSLFVWRDNRTFEDALPVYCRNLSFERNPTCSCPFCGVVFRAIVLAKGSIYDDIRLACEQCGFHALQTEYLSGLGEGVIGFGDAYPAPLWDVAHLKTLELNSSELGLGELGSHLRRNVSDIYALTPRRFELLVEDVFRNLGYRTQLTKQTRDGGYDVLLSGSDGMQVLVECKRYAKDQRVRVSTVRELLGVQLCKGVRFGKLVTTAYFTEPARSTALEVNEGDSGFHLDLIDIEELAKCLSVYNVALPPLEILKRFAVD